MAYYSSSSYKERWYVEFKDMNETTWRVSIEDPTYTGSSSVSLIGAANPFEWMGNGDDDQTKVIQGSTGTLRILVNSEANITGLRPSSINDRRVSVRMGGVLVWRGFLKQEEFNQDWVGVPYELELPVASVLETSKGVKIASSSSVSTIAEVLKLCVSSMGVDASIYTNMTMYIDYSGEKQSQNWTGASLTYSCLHVDANSNNELLTVGDVIEMIMSPLGHVREYKGNWYFMLDRKTASYTENGSSSSYSIGNLYLLNSSNSLTRSGSINNYRLPNLSSSDLILKSDNNTIGSVSAISSVGVQEKEVEDSEVLFEMNDELIDQKFSSISIVADDSSYYYADFNVSGIQFRTTRSSTMLRRVVQYDNDKQSFSVCVPIALLMGVTKYESLYVCPSQGVITSTNVNKVRMTLDLMSILGQHIGPPVANIQNMRIYLKSNGKYLYNNNGTLSWSSSKAELTHTDFTDDNGKYYIDFNEPRSSGDNSLKMIELELYDVSNYQFLVTVKFEYIAMKNSTSALRSINKGIDAKYNYDKVSCSGNGQDVTLEYKTLRGKYPLSVSSNYAVTTSYPRSGFYDRALLDTGARMTIDLEEVENSSPGLDCILGPSTATDGTRNYIVIAVGANAIEGTAKLKLIQTNI